jgi:hypothetical protein
VKRIVFLIMASLLVIGLVLPGCGEAEPEPVRYVFEDGKINIGIVGELNATAGVMQWRGKHRRRVLYLGVGSHRDRRRGRGL